MNTNGYLPGSFKDRSKELIRVLSGINLDERINGCKIIGKIAEKNPENRIIFEQADKKIY